jgi:hypothetical protein
VYTNDVKPQPVVKYHIYILNQTGWTQTALYAWAEGRNDIIGPWPGIRPAGTVSKEGHTYLDFQVEASVFPANFIFNNNAAGEQLKDIYLSQPRDYYLAATNNGISENPVLSALQSLDTTNNTTTKFIRNGQLLITHQGVTYTVLGNRF